MGFSEWKLFSFREVEIDDAKLLLNWRTKSRITKYMTSDVSHDIEAQKNWLKGTLEKSDSYHWISRYKNKDIGLMSLLNYKPEIKETSWGYYIGEDDALGYGGLIPPYFYNFVFNELNIEKIKAWVFFDNLKIIQMHLMHGYVFEPAEDHTIVKDGKNVLILCLILKKDKFESSKYNRFKNDFPMTKWKNRH